jgi:nucleotide-binding universal stress UspA family protein
MLNIKRILMPTDLSVCAEHGMRQAVLWAERYGAELHIFHVVADTEPGSVKDKKERAKTALADHIERYEPFSFKTRLELRFGGPAAKQIAEYVGDESIDLVVMGTHGRMGLSGIFMGSVAENVLRDAPCPVLVVPMHEREVSEAPPSRILVPVDFSDWSHNAVGYAKAIAEEHGAKILLLHVIEDVVLPDFYLAAGSALFLQQPEIRRKSEERLKMLFSSAGGPDVPMEAHVINGRAALDIAGFAEEKDVDFIVLPTSGLSGLNRLLIGSVAEKVVRRAVCPVLTLKPFGHQLIDTAATQAKTPAEVAP